MADQEKTVRWTADFSQLKSEIDQTNEKIEKLNASFDRTSKKFGQDSPQARMVQVNLERISAELDKKIALLEKMQNDANKPDGGGKGEDNKDGRTRADRDLEKRYQRESIKYYREFGSTFGRTASVFGKIAREGVFGMLGGGGGMQAFSRMFTGIGTAMMQSSAKSLMTQFAIAQAARTAGRLGSTAAQNVAGAVAGQAAAQPTIQQQAGTLSTMAGAAGGGGIGGVIVKGIVGAVGTLIAALGLDVGALSLAASDVSGRSRRARGFGSNIGAMTAFEDTMGRFVDPQSVMKSMQQAKFDITSPAFTAMMIGGINPAVFKDPAHLAEANILAAQPQLKQMYNQNPQTFLTRAHARGFQDRGFSDEDLIRLATGNQAEVNELVKRAMKAEDKLDIPDEERKKYDDLITNMGLATDQFKTWGEQMLLGNNLLGKFNDKLSDILKTITGDNPDAPTAEASPVSFEVGGKGGFRIPGESAASTGGRGPSAAAGFPSFEGKSPGAPVSNARTSAAMKAAMEQLAEEGVPKEHLRAAAAMLVGQAMSESSLNPEAKHDPYHGVFTGYGIYGARDPPVGGGVKRRTRMLDWLKAHGFASNSLEGQVKEMAHSAMHDFPGVRRLLLGATPENMLPNTAAVTGQFESPAVINDRRAAVKGAYGKGSDDVAPDDKKKIGPVSMNDMSHFQGHNRPYDIRISNPAGANYAVAGGMLGTPAGNFA